MLHVTSMQVIGRGGKIRTHLAFKYCRHMGLSLGHTDGVTSSMHCRFSLHFLSSHVSAAHLVVTFLPLKKKFGGQGGSPQ